MEVDIPYYCHDCSHLKYEGELMVGSIAAGGPEPAYSCLRNRNMYHYLLYVSQKRCPEYTEE